MSIRATKEEMRQEAERYMKQLQMSEEIIQAFTEKAILYVSYNDNGDAVEFSEDELDMVKRVEEEYEVMVYHVLRNIIFGIEMTTMLTVSSAKEDWKYGYLSQLDSGEFLTYAYVESYLESGIGSVVLAVTEGDGIKRVN